MNHEFGSIGHLLKGTTPKEYHKYMLQCAKDWDAGVCCKGPEPEQAAKVRKLAARFAKSYQLNKETKL